MVGTASKMVATLVEYFLYGVRRKKRCRYLKEYDDFDGKLYSVDEFYDMTKVYFDDPASFYVDYDYLGKLGFRAGVHPLELRQTSY